MLNDDFVSICNIEGNEDKLPDMQDPLPDTLLDSLTVTRDEVCKILKSLKCDKAAGHDGINNRVLKMTADATAGYLTELFNL